MSDEARMNPELKSLEASLQGLSVFPVSQLTQGSQRDETMYQAGWAAAMSSLNDAEQFKDGELESNSNSTHGAVESKWIWPAATFVATAAAIWLSILLLQNPTENQTEVVSETSTNPSIAPVSSNPSIVVDTVDPPNDGSRSSQANRKEGLESEVDLVQDILELPRGEILSSSFAFARNVKSKIRANLPNDRELEGAIMDRDIETDHDLDEFEIRRSKTQRELLEDLLKRT